MSEFEVKVERVLDVIKHPGADRLSIIKIQGYDCISANLDDGSPRYKKGDAVVYIPEAAVVPEWLLKKAGFWDETKNKGMLAGTQGNRVKPIRLRGIYSEGILYPIIPEVYPNKTETGFNVVTGNYVMVSGKSDKQRFEIGDNVSEYLGITKYEPEIPIHMSGEVFYLPEKAHKYDVEALKKYPNVLQKCEQVVYLEKIHGTQFAITVCHHYQNKNLFGQHNNVVLQSKGLGSGGKVFKNCEKNHESNIYVRMFDTLYENNITFRLFIEGVLNNTVIESDFTIFGEIYGRGVQDLDYKSTIQPSFRVFDILYNKEFMSHDSAVSFANSIGLEYVPEVARGPFDIDYAKILATGKESVSGYETHMREGIVVKPIVERRDSLYGRPIFKYVSEEYTLRKGNKTEYN